MEVAELFNHLESNQPQVVEQIKKSFHENFNAIKESWLVGGLYDYYVHTSSVRSVEILVGVREPHDRHLFDKIVEGIRGSSKLQALTLLGHVVRRQPTWLYKITQHPIMKELIKLLKAETDILPLMSALLVLIVLLPMIPGLIGPFLPDIFEVFSRLAAWKCTNPNKLPEEHLLHLQVALFVLFHRLYGMYPCNFLSYLRLEYPKHENLGTFSHTIKPMLDSVRMHPLLVTQSKEGETAALRWKQMEPHDVILECAKFAIEADRSSFHGARSCVTPARLESSCRNQPVTLAIAAAHQPEQDMWSPSMQCGFVTPPPQESAATPIPQPINQSYIVSTSLPHQEGTSPPEAAIEATPETTPIKDSRNILARQAPVNSNVPRALNSFGPSKWPGMSSISSTPTQSQPSSPMKKEPPFTFPSESSTPTSAFEPPRRDSIFQDPRPDLFLATRVQRVLMDRRELSADSPTVDKLHINLRPRSSGGVAPPSPLRNIGPHSPVPMDPTAATPGSRVSRPTPEKNGFRFDDSTREDLEVFEIVKAAEQTRASVHQLRQCDSVLQEVHPPHVDDYEECPQESGSPCMSGGLHMPNSRSMLDLARKVAMQHRKRYYSQCVPSETVASFSTGSSPGDGAVFLQQYSVRRTNSCPEMKKAAPASAGLKRNTLHEREELELEEAYNGGRITNGKHSLALVAPHSCKETVTTGTQTVNHWTPLPYEHLFLEVLPSVEHGNGEMAPSPAPSCAESPGARFSPHVMLDKYIDTVTQQINDARLQRDEPKKMRSDCEVRILKEQLFLLNIQLQFERHRREVHAERNRRLLGKSRAARAVDEHNSALREQLALLQADNERWHDDTERRQADFKAREKQYQETTEFWKQQSIATQREVKDLKTSRQVLEQEQKQAKEKMATVVKECQQVEKKLFDVVNDMRHAMEQASAGEQLRTDVEHLQKELLLMGELQQRYREQAARLHSARDEATLIRDSSRAEIFAMHELVDCKSSLLEAAKARVSDLEAVVTRRDMLISEQKRTLKLAKEEYRDQLEAVESKYRSQRRAYQRMEEHVVSLQTALETLERRARSPDADASVSVSSAGSAATRLLGLSPPLADALRMTHFVCEDVGMKNLQSIVEQSEQTSSLELQSLSYGESSAGAGPAGEG